MPPLVMKKVFSATKAGTPWFVRPVAGAIADKVNAGFIDPTLQKMFALVESTLQKNQPGQYLVGDHLSAADFQLVFPLEAAASRASE
jgi:glutathione S-transferase